MKITYRNNYGDNTTIDLSRIKTEFSLNGSEPQEMNLDEFIYAMLERITELERRCNAEDFGWDKTE